MATTAEGRRRQKNRSKKYRREAGATTTVLDLPDHLFEHILLRLGPSPCLVRAAVACRRWCRVVADPGFLARVRAAHPNAMRLGNYHNHNFIYHGECPIFVPVPTSPAAPLSVDVRRFVLDFLPDAGEGDFWEMADSRGSLLLLSTWSERRGDELVVCEPLTRRRQGILLPLDIPDFGFYLGMFLVDGDAGRPMGMSNFRIIGAVDEALACVFNPGSDGGWRLISSEATSEANLPWSFHHGNFVGRANGAIYWGIEEGDGTEVLVLNETTAEYSMVKFPEEIWGPYAQRSCASWVFGGEDGILCVVRLVGNDLKIFARHSCSEDDHDDNQWILEKGLVGLAEATVGLPGREESFFGHGVKIVGANAEYILLRPMLAPREEKWVFSVQVDTMRVEREHERNKYKGVGYPCELPWPPVLPNHVRRARR